MINHESEMDQPVTELARLSATLTAYVEAWEAWERAEQEVKQALAARNSLEEAARDLMLTTGIRSLKINGRTIALSTCIYCSAATDQAALVRAIRVSGDAALRSLVGETINSSKLSAWYREQLADEKEVPDELSREIKVTEKTTARVYAS